MDLVDSKRIYAMPNMNYARTHADQVDYGSIPSCFMKNIRIAFE